MYYQYEAPHSNRLEEGLVIFCAEIERPVFKAEAATIAVHQSSKTVTHGMLHSRLTNIRLSAKTAI